MLIWKTPKEEEKEKFFYNNYNLPNTFFPPIFLFVCHCINQETVRATNSKLFDVTNEASEHILAYKFMRILKFQKILTSDHFLRHKYNVNVMSTRLTKPNLYLFSNSIRYLIELCPLFH